jgi:hypothetical protein
MVIDQRGRDAPLAVGLALLDDLEVIEMNVIVEFEPVEPDRLLRPR